MASELHVETRDGGYYICGSRVSLESIVRLWRDGYSPEDIRDAFPALSLADVYGAITYYQTHQTEVDQYLRESEAQYYAQRAAAEGADPERYAKLHLRTTRARHTS